MKQCVKEYLRKLASLDQLESCLEDNKDSPIYELVAEYCVLSRKASILCRDIGLTEGYDHSLVEKASLILEKINRVINLIKETCDNYNIR